MHVKRYSKIDIFGRKFGIREEMGCIGNMDIKLEIGFR